MSRKGSDEDALTESVLSIGDGREDVDVLVAVPQEGETVVEQSPEGEDDGLEAQVPSPDDMRKGMCDALLLWAFYESDATWIVGTERFTSLGEFVHPQVQGEDVRRKSEDEVISFCNCLDVGRDVWFYFALLEAAIGHIYAWTRHPRKVEEVLDPRILLDRMNALTCQEDGHLQWVKPTFRDVCREIERVPSVA
ncbi:hypothetical protein CEP51_016858, partial [Fusarium floridanum]